MMRVTLLAGGVGGAKMAEGFAALDDVDLTIIGNVADDDEFHGLWVSPDIDTMLYTLSGRINRQQGWGVADEGHRALDTLGELGADTWMFLGDRDFGLHIYRTERLRNGDTPSAITADIAAAFGIKPHLILPTNDRVQTRVQTESGWITFQEYFVKSQCKPDVLGLRYNGLENAQLCQDAIDAIDNADLIVIAPSNPLVSIAPILGIGNLRTRIKNVQASVTAVSPLIAGKVVKGPADRMMTSLGLRSDAVGVAEGYADIVDTLFIDHADARLQPEISTLGVQPHLSNILIPDLQEKTRLAGEIVAIAKTQHVRGAA